MQCASSRNITKRSRIGDFSSLTRAMSSMRKIRQPCYGLSGMSGPVVHSLRLTATTTGPRWWFGTQGGGSVHFLYSKEGVTQGDPLAMIAYSI